MADDRTCIYCNIEQWDAVIHISFIHNFFWVEILCNIFIHIKCMPHTVRTTENFHWTNISTNSPTLCITIELIFTHVVKVTIGAI